MGVFEDALNSRQSEIRELLPRRSPGWLDRWLSSGRDGFLPTAQAAEAMGIGVEEVHEMARRGLLEWRTYAGRVMVRPACVSMLGVRHG